MRTQELTSAAAVAKTTAYPSKPSDNMSFPNHWAPFTQYAESQVPHFTVDATNRIVLEAVLAYFVRDDVWCQKLGIQPQKGLLLLGPVGCGKTTIMQLFASGWRLNSGRSGGQPLRLIPTRDIARSFLKEGYPVLEKYGANSYRTKHLGYGPVLQYDQPITYCFDDLGVEQNAKLYGNDCNVMAEILLDRYDQFVRHGMITHLTTNLNADELERLYGDRVRSRLREMFNLICFPPEAKDRRK